jgi:flagellar biosynthesis protein FlhB
MSDDAPDDDDKPLEPTEKRLKQALERGDQPMARDAPVVAMLCAASIGLAFLMVPAIRRISEHLAAHMSRAGQTALEPGGDSLDLLVHLVSGIALALVPIFAILALAGILASVLQNPPHLIADRVEPKLERISPAAGFKRIFGAQGMVEFAKALAKTVLAGLAALVVLHEESRRAASLLLAHPLDGLKVMAGTAGGLLHAVLAAALCVLAFDLYWTRHSWSARLRMTHQDMKDELKENDGDPMMKARRLARMRQSVKRMMSEVPKATVIITNPTHVAVALKYDASGAGVPQVVAKGRDELARRIKAVAAENGVPMVEDVPLARALESGVEVGAYIPKAFFQAIAEIIHTLQSRRSGSGIHHRRSSRL